MAGRLEEFKKLLLGTEEERAAIIADYKQQRETDPTTSDEDFWNKWAESKSPEVAPADRIAGVKKALGAEPPKDSFLSTFQGLEAPNMPDIDWQKLFGFLKTKKNWEKTGSFLSR